MLFNTYSSGYIYKCFLYIQNEYSRAKRSSYFVLHLIYLIARVFCSFEDIEFVVLGFNFPNSSWRCFKIEDEKNICPSSAHFDDYFSILYIPEIICARKKIHLKRKDSFHFSSPSSLAINDATTPSQTTGSQFIFYESSTSQTKMIDISIHRLFFD